ncbi:MAG: HAMP domain-containing histidine kinase [Clostridia bacterium]|nr:HAMP domain-containing histidine kinase [Clostridia bacterium]
MKKVSFKLITTLWITVLISVVCGVSTTALMLMSSKSADDKIKQNLIAMVQSNSDEMEYSNGVFEVENDFSYYSGGIYCDLFSENGEYISGETPHTLIESASLGETDVVEKDFAGENYYVYSKLLSFTKFEYEIDVMSGQIISYEADVTPVNELMPIPYSETKFRNGISTSDAIDIALSHAGVSSDEATIIGAEIPLYQDRQVFKIEFTSQTSSYGKIYIRAVCPSDDAVTVFDSVAKSAVYLLPFFVIIAAVGAYLISKKAVSPIEKITESAHEISTGNDLSKRLETSKAPREISNLSETFNGMFERLQTSFENEKRFTSDASHELRTPLAVIKAECEYALSEHADDEERMQALESIEEQTDKMSSLVSSLLAVTRAEHSRNRFYLDKANFSELTEEICAKFRPTKNIELIKDIEKNIEINLNIPLITQLIENLLSNADKYGKENGVINVKLCSEGDNVVLSVRDNGIGISEADLPKIWNRFYRADASRSETQGFGLGLALVKKIAEIHSAECVAKSEIGVFTEISIIFRAANLK